MKFKKIECKGCGSKESPLFMRSPPRHNEDVWCESCVENKKHLK